jgi:hypothetical protein
MVCGVGAVAFGKLDPAIANVERILGKWKNAAVFQNREGQR